MQAEPPVGASPQEVRVPCTSVLGCNPGTVTHTTFTMNISLLRAHRWARSAATLACAALVSTAAQAVSLLVDDFSAPRPASVHVLATVGEQSFVDTDPGVLGGIRGVYHHVYTNPLGSVAALAVGNGSVSSSTGVQARTEVLLSYGAFSRPTGDPTIGGPLLGVDGSPYNAFRMDFTGVSTTLNLNVVMYTASPLDPAVPLYYTTVGVNVAPASPGGPLHVELPFALGDPFNFGQIDGIVLVINRANGATNVAFNLDSFSLVSTVPEPGPALSLAAGLVMLGWLQRRRRSARVTGL